MIPSAQTLRTGRLSTISRSGLIAWACILGAGCTDGYPQKSAPVLVPAVMTQKQRVTEMNRIGYQGYLDTRWGYKLNASCELKVTTGRLFAKSAKVLPLKQGQVVTNIDRSDKTHDVHLKQGDELLPLLQTASWADSVSFYSIVQHLQRDCVPDQRA